MTAPAFQSHYEELWHAIVQGRHPDAVIPILQAFFEEDPHDDYVHAIANVFRQTGAPVTAGRLEKWVIQRRDAQAAAAVGDFTRKANAGASTAAGASTSKRSRG